MQDGILLQKLICRDEEALEAVIDQYHKLLWIIVEGVLGKAGTAEDIEECVSDVFIRLWRKPEAFDPKKGTLKVYLSVMARSMARNRYKTLAGKKTDLLKEEILSGSDWTESIHHKETGRQLYAAICKMKEPDKEILLRRYFYGEKPALIAHKTLLDKKEVENKLYQGKKKLQRMLKEALS